MVHSSYLSIEEAYGALPKDEKTRQKLGLKEPSECKLPIFKESSQCKAWAKALAE